MIKHARLLRLLLCGCAILAVAIDIIAVVSASASHPIRGGAVPSSAAFSHPIRGGAVPSSAAGALNATVIWDVRPSGSDSNGGGFDPGVGVPGTDYSQQSSAQIAYTDLTIHSVNTNYSSAGTPVVAGIVGNGFQIISGTGCVPGSYEVLSQGSSIAVVNRFMGTPGSVCTANLGGALLTPLKAAAVAVVSGQVVFFKSGTYSTATIPLSGTNNNEWRGYHTTHGDLTGLICPTNCPVFTTSASAPVITVNGASSHIENIVFATSAGSPSFGLECLSKTPILKLIADKFSGFSIDVNCSGIGGASTVSGSLIVSQSEIATASADGIEQGGTATSYLDFSYIHGNAHNGYTALGNSGLTSSIGSVFDANGNGTSTYCALQGGPGGVSQGSVYSNQNGGCGLYFNPTTTNGGEVLLSNNIMYGNGTYGAVLSQVVVNLYNAYGSNGSGGQSGYTSGYGDVALSACNPFVNASAGNFALSTCGLAALSGLGYPGVAPFGTGTKTIGPL